MTDTGASKGGRPTEYKEEYVEQVAKLCDLGATDDEIADFFDVSVRTIHRWKIEHPEFCHSLKSAKGAADERVERSLYQKATGYNFVEEQAHRIKVEQFKDEVEVVKVERHQPADTTAAIFWLKNRRKDQWRDKMDHEHTGKDGKDLMPQDNRQIARKILHILSAQTLEGE